MMNDSHSQPGILLSPKASFFLGISSGVLVIFSIGFFVLLGIMLSGGSRLALADNGTGSGIPTQPAAPTADAPTVVGEVKAVDKTDHVSGDANAKVTLIEYSDFQCPFCQRFEPTIKQIMDEYKGRVRLVYRHYPLSSIHPEATPAALAAECASEQGKFFEYGAKLFESQAILGTATYGNIADQLKLNRKTFDACLSSKKYQAKVDGDQASGNAAGVSGTPATIIIGAKGGKQIVEGAQAYANVRAMVEAALNE
jgi:protein-disulfide isomerase